MTQSGNDRTNLYDPETCKRTLRRDSLTVVERLRILEWESVNRHDAISMVAHEADQLRDQLDALELRLAPRKEKVKCPKKASRRTAR
jgi:ubiquinone biosynthesis protein UbiJ